MTSYNNDNDASKRAHERAAVVYRLFPNMSINDAIECVRMLMNIEFEDIENSAELAAIYVLYS